MDNPNAECTLDYQMIAANKDLETLKMEYHTINNLLDKLEEGETITVGDKGRCAKQSPLNNTYRHIICLSLEDRLKYITHCIDIKANEIYNFKMALQTQQKLKNLRIYKDACHNTCLV